jgi:hypothetical protein
VAVASPQKKRLDDLEKTSEGIRRDFDQFFLGQSRRAPTAAQAQFAGLMRKLKEEELKEWGTQDRFRFNQIHQRFVSMERIWARTLKQIEEGTHKRDKMKVAMKRAREEEAMKAAASQLSQEQPPSLQSQDPLDSIDVDMNGFDEDPKPPPPPAPKPVPKPVPKPQPAVASTPPRAGDLGGLSEQRLQMLYKVYMDAKKRTGEASTLSFEALRSQIAKQVPQIRQKHNCEQVDFKVVLKDGKAMLKAIPK